MTPQDYRTQFENQVKDLTTQYAQTHGHAPDVRVEWGKPEPARPEIISCPNCGEKWDLSKHNACQCGAQLVGELLKSYNKGVIDGRKFQKEDDLKPEPDRYPGSEPPNNKKNKRLDDAWDDLGNTLYDMGNDEPGW